MSSAALEAELQKLRKINRVLMERVERDMDAQGGDGYSLFRTAITLEARVSERTAELSRLTHQLMHEVSQRRLAEKALLAAKAEAEQANLGKTRFLAAATHDLYQPLNAARLFLGALAEETQGPRARELLGRVDAALDTIDELLAALLDISRLDAGAWPVASANVAIGAMLLRLADEYRPQAHAAGLDLRVVPCSAVICTDRHLLERVLRNLISNAIRYTAEGRVLIGCRRRGDRLSIEVWDSGLGIPEEKRSEIFEEFHRLGNAPRRDGKGLGLGLAIVDRIARLLDLRVELASVVGRGSRFAVSVARATSPDSAETPVAAPAPVGGVQGKCVLVIDNDAAALDAMQAVLESWGCRLVTSASPADGLRQLATLGTVPDCVVIDYHLDDDALGTEGVAALRRAFGDSLPALVISADHSAELRAGMKALGQAFLTKPINPARLRAMMSYLLGRSAAG